MGLPSISMTFKQASATAIARGERGIVALLLKDTVPTTNPIVMNGVSEIPTSLTAANQEQIGLAFKGYTKPPIKVIAYVITTATVDYTTAQTYLETIKWDYFAFPGIADAEVAGFATWIKGLRDTKDLKVKAVLPNYVGDHEGIINYCNTANVTASKTYTAKEYCSRIAGLLAGTPLTISATYAVLPELIDCDHLTKSQFDTAINAGKFVLMNDGEKVKVARAVNSLTTITSDKGSDFQKIKIVDIMDQIHDDIKKTIADNYIGKVSNSYDNKVVLIMAIGGYFEGLEFEGLLEKGTSSVGIDLSAQTVYLKSIGMDTTSMKDLDIKLANTNDKVFITSNITILDAMEDITLSLNM